MSGSRVAASIALAAVVGVTSCRDGDESGTASNAAEETEEGPPMLWPTDLPTPADLPGPTPDVGEPLPDDAYQGLVRFIALGDGGEGNDSQYAVADIVEQVCAQRGCDFAIYLGDNFYDVGVTSVMDEQFLWKFERPYADLDLMFYITLGNHDYGVIGQEWMLAQYQVEYSQYSGKWELPHFYYAFDREHVKFISLDTSRMFWNHEIEPQRDLVREALAEAEGSKFTVAFGHHPYISNGRHGNAGNYEGISAAFIRGKFIKEFFDAEVCDKVTVYFSGHDHNRQWHRPPEHCATHFIVSGAAAKTTEGEGRDDNPEPRFEEYDTPGFAWVEIADSTMTVAFYDENGENNLEDSVELRVE